MQKLNCRSSLMQVARSQGLATVVSDLAWWQIAKTPCRRFAAFLGRAPDTATVEDIRRSQLHQHENGVGPSLKRRDLARALAITRNPRKLPDVLSIGEAARLLKAAPGIKYKAALGVAYGAGLRVSEVAHLKVDDIDSTFMLIRVEQGKGRKDRSAMRSPQLLELLRLWWREESGAA